MGTSLNQIHFILRMVRPEEDQGTLPLPPPSLAPAPIKQPGVSVPNETGAAHCQQMRDKGTGWRQVALT